MFPVPYSWDEVTFPERLCIHIKGVSEPRQFNLSTFGPQGKVYYESYFYIVAVGTKTDQSHLPESQQINGELVLDVPQGRAVLLTRKVIILMFSYFKSPFLNRVWNGDLNCGE